MIRIEYSRVLACRMVAKKLHLGVIRTDGFWARWNFQ
jgi:hypothetical protein